MRVYVVFWAYSESEWRLVDVFSSKDKLEKFMATKSDSYWYEEKDLI